MAGGLLGGLLGGGSARKADTAPAKAEIDEESKKSARARTAMLNTQGGVMGEELDEGLVTRRDNIFGN